jgi:hypothetical protein
MNNLSLTASQRRLLIRSHLGLKKWKIADVENITKMQFNEGILRLFPALSLAGGYQICLAENIGCHVLEVMEHTELSVCEIRQIVGQSKMYLRPASDLEVMSLLDYFSMISCANKKQQEFSMKYNTLGGPNIVRLVD